MNTFMHGVNLGGWLSQCETRQNHSHYSTFITRDDLVRISQWGFDHVRLPVDYCVITTENDMLDVDIMKYVDDCLLWCGELELGMVLDMHMLPGYNIATASENDLFNSAEKLQRSCGIWEQVAERYKHIGDRLRFELLNEPEWANSYEVQETYRRLMTAVRRIDQNRVIILGGNHYYHVDYLEGIWKDEDPNTVLTFHYYEPNLFTNQLYAKEHGKTPCYEEEVDYPGDFPRLAAYLDKAPGDVLPFARYCWIKNDKALMQQNLQKAVDCAKYHRKEMYLGEFGVCYYARPERRCRWIADLLSIVNENKIGWCYWSYKEMDYGLVNINGQVISSEVIDTLRQSIGK